MLLIIIIYGLNHFVFAGPKEYKDISVADFYGKFKGNTGIFLLDVRTPEEYRELHVPGTSRLIPVEALKNRMDELKGLEDKEIYIICRSGRRSRTASEMLAGQGFKKIFNITGGVMEYKNMNYPIEQGGSIP